MRVRLAQAALFLLVFILALLVWMPATVLDAALRQWSGERLMLADAQGTLWRGAGQLLLRHEHHFLPLGRYAWRIAPRLDPAALEVRLETGERPAAVLALYPWRNELALEQAQLTLPAQLLPLLARPLSLYRLGGVLQLSGNRFSLRPGHYDGAVQLDWQAATSALTDLNPLGDYRITLRGGDDRLDVGLETVQGKLLLQGTGRIAADGRLTMQGSARAAPGQEAALSDLLHHIGPETAPGVFGFALGGQ